MITLLRLVDAAVRAVGERARTIPAPPRPAQPVAPVPLATPLDRALAIARLVPELGADGMRDVEQFIRRTGGVR